MKSFIRSTYVDGVAVTTRLTAAAALLSTGLAFLPATAQAEDILIGVITKTEANPFFAKIREGATSKAAEIGGVKIQSFAGKFDGDNDSQVAAIENLISAGAKGILVVPSDTKALVTAVEQARKAGILVIALDTPLEPAEAADATFATDNFKAGELIGSWAAKTVADPSKAKIAFVDALENQPTVDVARDQGFMKGFGLDPKDVTRYLDEDDKRIVGHQWGQGSEEGGRTGMETLLQKDNDISVVYTINEPTAAGAYEALKAAGKDGSVIITSVDGGCPGVKNVKAGVIGATSMQYPLKMASLGVEAIVDYIKSGKKPAASPGLPFFDTGVTLVTDKPVTGVESITSDEALKACWG
ncbi:substrate-binding domain-containing protein [Rhizobium sp. NZLR3b]|uniref:substrate-binding domain-containing protein n=1 Tax=Rhizobium sp. NZLR3b TaxID=2731101 RepID=UPI001C83629D|nr:substrate-binding domain-containing protein [Rhizobium sp. NZLR3b]MBX5193656.1 substrate-binding domain-containing protein [Rhizobium sp. NZLR3b]